MKTFSFTLFALLFAIPARAIDHYENGDTLHVWAKNGLRMRSSPDAKSEVLATLPYGEKVVVADDSLRRVPFSTIEGKVFKINGFWVKVRAGEQVGFVFDGFLGRLPVLKKTKTSDFEKVEVWAAREFGFKKKPIEWKYDKDDPNFHELSFTTKNEIKYSLKTRISGTIQISDISMIEACFLAVTLPNNDSLDFQVMQFNKTCIR